MDKDLDLKKIFKKKENLAWFENVGVLLGGPIAVLDLEGNIVFGRKSPSAKFSSPVKSKSEVVVGRVLSSSRKKADSAAFLVSHFVSTLCLQKSLAAELLKKYKEHDILNNINDRTSLYPKPDEIAVFIVKGLAKLIKLDLVSIELLGEKTGNLEVIASFGTEISGSFCRSNFEKIKDNVFKSGKGEIVNDKGESDKIIREKKPGKKAGNGLNRHYCSYMSVPLKAKDRVIGLINVCSFDKEGFYYSSDLKTLSTIASLAANLIEITRLYNVEKEHSEALLEKNAALNTAKEIIIHENINLKRNLRYKFSVKKIIGVSNAVKDLREKIDKISNINSNILITGESGTGKELAARAIHYSSDRAVKPFVAINCSAIPASLFESEIFGIEKGVATGVDKRRGKIAEADEGTLFLDEIGNMAVAEQAKLLRVIQDMEVVPVGGSRPVRFDVRIIAATNKKLKNEMETGNFREDLFYRLNVINLEMPPLRKRIGDVSVLANYFLKSVAVKFDRIGIKFSQEALKIMGNYSWPGNIRELENEVERAVALCVSDKIYPEDLSDNIRESSMKIDTDSLFSQKETDNLEENEKIIIKRVLLKSNGNQTVAAKMLGITREGLSKKMKRLGLR